MNTYEIIFSVSGMVAVSFVIKALKEKDYKQALIGTCSALLVLGSILLSHS